MEESLVVLKSDAAVDTLLCIWAVKPLHVGGQVGAREPVTDESRAQCVRVCVNYVTAGNQMFLRHQPLKNCSHFTRLVLFALAI